MTADARGHWVNVRPGLSETEVEVAVRTLVRHLAACRAKDVVIQTIDGAAASSSAHTSAFVAAGLRLTTAGLRYYASFERA